MSEAAATKATRISLGPMAVVTLALQITKPFGLTKHLMRPVMRMMQARMRNPRAFEGYTPTEHDVIVATFAKSGTNWMMQIAQQIAHRGESEFAHIHDVVPWPDAPAGQMVHIDDPVPLAASPTGLRVIKTHLATESVPYDEKARYLTVLRDPKEVLVSSYYFLGGMLGVLSHVNMDDWFELGMGPDGLMSSWAEHTDSFWRWRDRPNVLVLGYPEIKRDARGCLERVAATMGVELTEAQLARVIERSSLAYMQAHESQFAPPKPPFAKEADRPKMVRRGASGGSDEALSHAQQAEIDRFCQAELRGLGSDFPYAEMFDAVAEAPAA